MHEEMDIIKRVERRDLEEILPRELPVPFAFVCHREFVRETLNNEVIFRALDGRIIDGAEEQVSDATIAYREQVNAEGSPSEIAAAGYVWSPGTEMTTRAAAA